MTLSATGGLSMGIDAFNYTSIVPYPDLPTVTTAPVTNIGPNSALGGGNVITDGGAAVTARGVCWSTLANPTILDNHTTDGSGIGPFASFISPLLPSTDYNVRAYATNITGTAYGEELIFTTHSFVPDHRVVQDVTVYGGQIVCYDAIYTITVAGGNTEFLVEPLGEATFVAGLQINFLPHSTVMYSGYLRAYIDPAAPWCPEISPPQVPVIADVPAPVIGQSFFRIYPNPTTGDFTLEQVGERLSNRLSVEICSMRGEKLMRYELQGERTRVIGTSGLPPGLYFIKVQSDEYVGTIKLIKSR